MARGQEDACWRVIFRAVVRRQTGTVAVERLVVVITWPWKEVSARLFGAWSGSGAFTKPPTESLISLGTRLAGQGICIKESTSVTHQLITKCHPSSEMLSQPGEAAEETVGTASHC